MRAVAVCCAILCCAAVAADEPRKLAEAAYTLPNILRQVPPLRHDPTGRFPMIAIEVFRLGPDDRSWDEATPFPPETIRALKQRGLTQWIPPDARYIPFAQALQREGAGVIMVQGQAFNGPPDQAPESMHQLPADYVKLERPGQQPTFPCPLVLDGWVITQQKLRETFAAFRAAGVAIDAVWLDWEIEPDWREAQLDEARHCTRCRKQFPPGVLDDPARYRQFIEQWRVQLFSAYVVAPILESYPHISVTNWEEIQSTPDCPTPSWSGTRDWAPKDLGLFTAANPVAYGNTIWKRYNWKDEWGWPLDEAHMDRVYTSVMLNQLSVHTRNAERIAPWKQCIPWVDRFCADDRDPTIPILSRVRYREILRHCWLRGADGMQIFNPLWFKDDAAKLAIATEELIDAVEVYDELLAYRTFLDGGTVLNTETLAPTDDGPLWSGLRLGDEAVVRAFTQAPKPVTCRIRPFADAGPFEIEAPPDGRWHHLRRPGAPAAPTPPARPIPAAGAVLQDYARTNQLDRLPPGTASLYRVPWRSNVRTASAAAALEGVGVYYKHIPGHWTQEDHVAVMRQLAAAGVRRLRLAPHFAIYITPEWTAPKEAELASLRLELRACAATGLRPCVIFVHIPPVGTPGTRELQEWWRQGELLPAGDVGSPEFKAYLDKTYTALQFILREAREAGFTRRDSYDLELAQGLWWGAPSAPRPMPGADLTALQPGGRLYEFDRNLIVNLRRDGYREPTVWWGLTHHHFEDCADTEVPSEAAGRAISFYSAWSGITARGWLGGSMYDRDARGPDDVWPVRSPLVWHEAGPAPELLLAKPEGWMADFSRRDNLIALLRASQTPTAITSLGTVPGDLPEPDLGGLDGWQLKQRGLTRSLAFWLNQGAPFVLLHSAFEPGAARDGELTHALIPGPLAPEHFQWHQAPPLVTLRSFCDGLQNAKRLDRLDPLSFRFALEPDPTLIPAMGTTGPLKASDALALLTFQLDAKAFAVAAYVVSPDVRLPLGPLQLTLEVDRQLTGTPTTLRPFTGRTAVVRTSASSTPAATTLTLPVYDDVTWLRIEVK